MKKQYTPFKFFNSLVAQLQNSRIVTSPSLIKAFGIFGVVNFAVFYLLWNYIFQQEYNGFYPRLMAFAFCLPLTIINYWPEKIKPYISAYWYLAILYCLPVFGVYMFLENHESSTWHTNVLLGIFWLVLVTDWLSFVIILPAGIVVGWLAHYLIKGSVQLDLESLSGPLMNYAWAIVIAAVFSHRKELIRYEERIDSIKMLAGAIAHELRTPLASISMMSTNLKKSLTRLFESQENQGSTEPDKALMSMPERLNSTAKNAFTIIDMVLMNLKDVSGQDVSKIISMEYYVRETLADYPLTETEKSLINFNPTTDFEFKGDETLFKHVLFNLLKNALHYVKASGKGEITITLKPGRYENQLIFKDTGKGMPESMVPHIFDRFYSRTQHGTGIGLAFCKSVMSKFKGSIACESIENVHTTFILSFPVVTEFEKAVAA